MYTPTKLTEYKNKYKISWAKQLPNDTPPENVVVAYDKEPLFRLIKENGVMTEEDLKPLVFERLFYSGYVAMAKIRFTEFLPSTGCHHSVCPHYRHLARP